MQENSSAKSCSKLKMTELAKKNIKIFLGVVFLSLPFWWLFNALEKGWEDFFYARQFSKRPLLIAQLSADYSARIPQRISGRPDLQINSLAAISVLIDKQGREHTLFQKNGQEKLAIASITKLLTGITALDIYSSSMEISITKEVISQPEPTGDLKVGERLQVSDLLKIMLIESSNDAAFALAQVIGEKNFVSLMNLETQDLGLVNSYFFNSSGLDPEDVSPQARPDDYNYSSAEDLVKLTKYFILEKPEVLKMLGYTEYPLYLENGIFHHVLKNTNELLGKIPNVLGGKTGYTERAGECLILILKGPWPDTYFINVLLGAQDKFQEMEQLINWVETSYKF